MAGEWCGRTTRYSVRVESFARSGSFADLAITIDLGDCCLVDTSIFLGLIIGTPSKVRYDITGGDIRDGQG
jgi:hypothetical protein